MMGSHVQRSRRCSFRDTVDRHFAGRVRPDEEVALREHLPGCALCHARYERQLLMAKLAHDRLAGIDRLAIGLGLTANGDRAERYSVDGRWLAGGVAVVAGLAWFLGRDPAVPAPPPHAAAAPAPATAAPEPAADDPAAAGLTLIHDEQRQQCRVVPLADVAGK
jgi:hypothetical protein